MYYLYIDESGDEGQYLKNGNRNGNSSRFFTLGGIIIHESVTEELRRKHWDIIDTHFKLSLHNYFFEQDFVLHYQSLRNSENNPYYKMSKNERGIIADKMFESIINTDCKLISVTLDLLNHFQYPKPAHPRYYSLLLLLERFQYFLEDVDSSGIVVYESFSSRFHRKMQRNYKILQKTHNIPNPSSLNRIKKDIVFKKKHQEPILQFADFVADVTWIRSESLKTKTIRWDSIKHKYYNLDNPYKMKRGNCEI